MKKLLPLRWLALAGLMLACRATPDQKSAAARRPTGMARPPVSKPIPPTSPVPAAPLLTGAAQLPAFLPGLRGQRVAVVVNNTSRVGETHLVDTLLRLGVAVQTIFAPEHGFRGEADAGETVKNGQDTRTGLPIISLYGTNKKPKADQLANVDAVVFDIQDVGARFYTYISTLHYVMEACAENRKPLLVLDRPNPNGDYVDGPVLTDPALHSFVGMFPIPIVHGLTVGELATMINGEKWLAGGLTCELKVVPVANYTHQTRYQVPVRPSPNLPNAVAVRLYPSLCLFEGTNVSLGRGTELPFQVIGAPDRNLGSYTFTPVSRPGAKSPPLENQTCYGLNLSDVASLEQRFTLRYLLDFYQKSADKDKFFITNNFFEKLAGTTALRQQVRAGLSEAAIRATWQPDLDAYKLMRRKYLLYAE